MAFTKAKRTQAKLKIGIYGPSGSGKTYGALLVAKGLGGRIAVIDSERGSSTLFDNLVDFDVDQLDATEPEAYIEKIKDAVKANYDVVVVDSITHEWDAVKGQVDEATEASRSKNSYTAWREPSQKHARFVNALLHAPVHLIVTMREKDQTEMIANEGGKLEPVKIGTKPDQRKGFEYELTTVFRVDRSHIAVVEKDRTQLFDGFRDRLSPSVGEALRNWMTAAPITPGTARASEEKKRFVFTLLSKLNANYDDPRIKQRLLDITGKESITFWTEADVDAVTTELEKAIKDRHDKSKAEKKLSAVETQAAAS